MKVLFLSSRLPHIRVVSGHMIVYQRITRLFQRGYELGRAGYNWHKEPPGLDPKQD